ncbi:MAG: PIG-L family deacetylase [Spirochaetaceae bacterium]|jgi:LmbE family N-acetylglucosaminyl deacetylase|nr:PIG-L family deacetylase [Spirochaetaceae bacterium]
MNILGIGCHPDDLEIGCGGTLAKYVKQGHQVFMCHIANGNLGHVVIQPEELRELRDQEAKNAAAVIGAESISIDVGDLQAEASDKKVRDALTEVVRYTRADLIITHNPQDYMRDHEQVSFLAQDVSFTTTIPHLLAQTSGPGTFPPVFFMDTLAGINFIPTEYVDITEEIEKKLEAINCHKSQVVWMREHDHIDFLDFIRTCNKYRGLQSNCAFAEGFRQYAAWPRLHPRRFLP